MKAIDRKLLRDMWRIKSQALAIALVAACGVAVVIMAFGTLRSLEQTRAAYYDRYRFADVFATARRAPEWLAQRAARIPGVAWLETRIVRDVVMDVPGAKEPALARLVSLPRRGEPRLNAPALLRGRMPEPTRPDEVVASANFVEATGLAPGARIGAVMNGHKRQLTIVGVALSPEYVYALGPGQLMPDDKNFAILWMSRQALEAAFDLDGAFNDLSLALMPGSSEATVIERLDKLLAPYGGVGAYGRRDQLSHAFLDSELNQLRMIGQIIPPIFLAVSAFLIGMVMARLVEVERGHIGLLKAIGYSNVDIGWHYGKLVLIVTGAGLVLGIVGGIWLGKGMTVLYAEFYRFPLLLYELDAAALVIAVAMALAAAAVGATMAVRAAVTLPPAVAMAPATPVVYRHLAAGMLARLPVTAPSRMIARHLIRWPLRALLTTIGIAMAVALLVTSLFSFDSIDHMLDVFYYRSQHQDLTISFVEPIEERVLYEVRHLPGVIAAEGFRSVPVRLRFGPRNRLVTLKGVVPDASLTAILDRDLRAVQMPPQGIVLSDKLAELLAAEVGDTITVEVLQGRRTVAEVPVTAVVQEYIGTNAYMDATALARLLREAPSASGALMVIDPAQRAALFGALKETPVVAGTMLRERALRSFRDTAAETMTIVVSFYVLFAGTIAFGVVYNSGRIALAERARELATLRVIGYSNGEVIYILLGELALLTLVAMPLGCVFGTGLAWLVAQGMDSELFRVPLVIADATYGKALTVVAVAAVLSSAVVARRVRRLDLVGVLKTRE